MGGADCSKKERELAEIADAVEVYTDAVDLLRMVGEGEPTPRTTQLKGEE